MNILFILFPMFGVHKFISLGPAILKRYIEKQIPGTKVDIVDLHFRFHDLISVNEFRKNNEDERCKLIERLNDIYMKEFNLNNYDAVCISCANPHNKYNEELSVLSAVRITRDFHGKKLARITSNFSNYYKYFDKIINQTEPGEIVVSNFIKPGDYKYYLECPDFTGDPAYKKSDYLPYTARNFCPFTCIFCNTKQHMMDYPYDRTEKMIADLSLIINEMGIKKFKFYNSEFNITKQICRDLLPEIKKLGITFSDSAVLVNLDDDIIKLFKEAGCTRLVFGLESGSERMIRFLKKNSVFSDMRKNLEMLNKVYLSGIEVEVNFLYALPFEQVDDFLETIKIIKYVSRISRVVYISRFKMCQGTIIRNNQKDFNVVYDGEQIRWSEGITSPDKVVERGNSYQRYIEKNFQDYIFKLN